MLLAQTVIANSDPALEWLRLQLLEALRAMPELVAVNEPHVARWYRCHEVFVGETCNDITRN